MADQSFSELALIEVVHLMQPLKSLTLPEQLFSLIKKLGYELPFKQEIVTHFNTLANTIDPLTRKAVALAEAKTENDRKAAALAMVPEVAKVLTAMGGLGPAIKTAWSLGSNVDIGEFPRQLHKYILFFVFYFLLI